MLRAHLVDRVPVVIAARDHGYSRAAFYLVAEALGGNAWEKAGRIWYVALRDLLRRSSKFADAARLTAQAAGGLFGANGAEERAVRSAWQTVGVG